MEDLFGGVVEAGHTSCVYTDRFSRNNPIDVCRQMKRPVAEV